MLKYSNPQLTLFLSTIETFNFFLFFQAPGRMKNLTEAAIIQPTPSLHSFFLFLFPFPPSHNRSIFEISFCSNVRRRLSPIADETKVSSLIWNCWFNLVGRLNWSIDVNDMLPVYRGLSPRTLG